MRSFVTGLFLFIGLSGESIYAQHAHINAGAIQPQQNSQLYFVNGGSFVTNSGYVMSLERATNGPLQGLYQGSTTFTALPATIFTGGPAFGHSALGSYLQLKTVSVRGPTNGMFGIWLEDEDFGTATRLVTAQAGITNGTQLINLSEGDGASDADPYGHIHGRRFSFDYPGFYTVGFQIVDTSVHGTGGGPIHLPSDIFYMHFQAGITVARVVKTNQSNATIYYATGPGKNYQLESTDAFRGTNTVWSPVGPIHPGEGHLESVVDPTANVAQRFYRLKVTTQ